MISYHCKEKGELSEVSVSASGNYVLLRVVGDDQETGIIRLPPDEIDKMIEALQAIKKEIA